MSATCQHPFRLRRCRVPAGAECTFLSPVQFVPPRTAPIARGSNTISYEEPASGAPSPRRRERANAHGPRKPLAGRPHRATAGLLRARASRAPRTVNHPLPRPARAPPGGGTVWRAPRARRTLLTVLNLFIARPRVRRSRPGRPPHVNAARRRPAVPPRHRPSPTAHRGAPPTPVVRGARLAPVARGAAARRSAGDVPGVMYRGRHEPPMRIQ